MRRWVFGVVERNVRVTLLLPESRIVSVYKCSRSSIVTYMCKKADTGERARWVSV